MEIAETKQDWEAVAQERPSYAGRESARCRAASIPGASRGKTWSAQTKPSAPIEALLKFDTTDVAETHYRLATLLRDDAKAGSCPPPHAHGARRSAALPCTPTSCCSNSVRVHEPTNHLPHRNQPSNDPLQNQNPRASRSPRSRCASVGVANIGTAGAIQDDRAGVPEWENDPEFKNDVFTFVRVQYDSLRRARSRPWSLGRRMGRSRRLAHRFSRQRLQLLLPPAATHVA